jgi:uncharacterized protein YjbJ (UPF0337 family)
MHEDELKGTVKEAAGKVQSEYGDLTDSPENVAEGERKQAEGSFQKGVGKVKDALHDIID